MMYPRRPLSHKVTPCPITMLHCPFAMFYSSTTMPTISSQFPYYIFTMTQGHSTMLHLPTTIFHSPIIMHHCLYSVAVHNPNTPLYHLNVSFSSKCHTTPLQYLITVVLSHYSDPLSHQSVQTFFHYVLLSYHNALLAHNKFFGVNSVVSCLITVPHGPIKLVSCSIEV